MYRIQATSNIDQFVSRGRTFLVKEEDWRNNRRSVDIYWDDDARRGHEHKLGTYNKFSFRKVR